MFFHFQLSIINLPSIFNFPLSTEAFTWIDRMNKRIGAAKETVQKTLAKPCYMWETQPPTP